MSQTQKLTRSLDQWKYLEDIRSRLLFKSFDAIVTAPVRSKRRVVAHIQSILNPASPNYDRVASVAGLLDNLIPGTISRITRFLYSSGKLPFYSPIELLSYGSGATVFLLKNDEPKVLKIYRRSLGKNLEGVSEVVNWYKQRYEMVSSWYNGRFNLVPPATFFVLHGPILGRPAAAMLQLYICGEKKDFFRDFSNEELISLMRENPVLREQFLFFTQQTLDNYKKHNLCFDFVGRENLMLVKTNNSLGLQIADIGVFELDAMRRESPARFSQVEEYISRLNFLGDLLQQST